MPGYTWKTFLRHLKERGIPLEEYELVANMIYENALEEAPFNPKYLLQWGKEKLLDPRAFFLHTRMQEKLLTPKDLTQALGVSPALVSLWLKGASHPRPEYYVHLARLLGVPVSNLEEIYGEREGGTTYPRKILNDTDLPVETRFFKRFFLMYAKANYILEHWGESEADRRWFRAYLGSLIGFLSLAPFKRIQALRAKDIVLEDGEGIVYLHNLYSKGKYASRRLYPLVKKYWKREVWEGVNPPLWGEIEGIILKDVLRPFRVGSLKRFLRREGSRLLGRYGFNRMVGRHKGEAPDKGLAELWEEYLFLKGREHAGLSLAQALDLLKGA